MTDYASLLRAARTIAVVGCSSDPGKTAHSVPRQMQACGFRIIPVNPHADVILGERVYRTLTDIPWPVDLVNLFRPSEQTPPFVEEAAAVGAPAVWLQLGIANSESRRIAEAAGLVYVEDRCIAVERAKAQITH